MSDQLCINAIRVFCADMVQKANSGHPGAPMGMAPMAHTLFSKFLNFSAENPHWFNRDRFVLSNGHACALLYTMLHLTGYESFPLEQLLQFRQYQSNTPGHPEAHFGGIEVSTGPLGQGLSNAVGLAIAQEHLAATYNKPDFNLFSNHTYVFCGDGCLMEGITSEAASLAGHLRLGRLIVLYDDNKISIDGSTDLAFTEDVTARFEAYGWHTLVVDDGDNDLDAIAHAIEAAKNVVDRPSLIKVRTSIGFGSKKEKTAAVHGSPLGDEDIANVKKKFGFDPNVKLHIPDEVRAVYSKIRELASQKEAEWNALFAAYGEKYSAEHAEIKRRFSGVVPAAAVEALPHFKPEDPAAATRKLSQDCLNALAPHLPELIGGSADLTPSTLTDLKCSHDIQYGKFDGRYIRFGVREHAMGAIVNGISAYGGFLPYGSTFLNFLGYMLGAVTLSSLSRHQVFYVMTHDSIGLGEDGPTHQPVEKLMLVRSTPNALLLRPADGNETSGAYQAILAQSGRPAVLALSRQNLPQLAGSAANFVLNGAYVLQEAKNTDKIDLIIAATGSEVHLCVNALKQADLADYSVRIVSMPSWELFAEQPAHYKSSVFPEGIPVLSVEAGVTIGWDRYAHASIGIDTFGASAPANVLYEQFGFSPANIASKGKATIEFYRTRPVPSKLERPF